jgi:cell division protein ZapE
MREAYAQRLRDDGLQPDSAQMALVETLDALAHALCQYARQRAARALPWRRLRPLPSPPRGLYIWGDVGRGKTMLMDLFFHALDAPSLDHTHKRRVHFHEFMSDVHQRLRMLRADNIADPLEAVADAIARETWLFCFDEMAVTDITDAMLLGRLFTALIKRKVVFVATSNVPPQRLYENGLNRALFLPFVDILSETLEVVELCSMRDYRRGRVSLPSLFVHPFDETATQTMDAAFLAHSGTASGERTVLSVLGHPFVVPQLLNGVARFSFHELCGAMLGAADYAALAAHAEIVVLDDIPVLTSLQRNEARRFILLIDTLYEKKVKLIASSAVAIDDLYKDQDGREAFEFARTRSRLHEMQAEAWGDILQ